MALIAQTVEMLGSEPAAQRLPVIDEALVLARRAGRADAELAAWQLRINDLLAVGDVVAAESESERFMQIAAVTRVPAVQWSGLVTRACLALLAGRFADSERLAAEAIAARRDAQDAAVVQVFVMQGFIRRLETGDVGAHEEMLARFTREFPDNHGWRPGLAMLLAESGREEEARALFAQIAAVDSDDFPRDPNFLGGAAMLALLCHRFGDARCATKLAALLAPFASDAVTVFIQPAICLGSVARYLALLAATVGDGDRAVRYFEDAIAMNTRMGARPYLARVQAEYGRFLLARDATGDRERAADLLAEARATAGALGQHVLREELGRVDVPHVPSRVPHGSRQESPPTAALRKEGDLWTVRYRDDVFHVKDSKGIAYLATLLRHPGREHHVLDLVAGGGGGTPAAPGAAGELGVASAGDAGELLDPAARAAYKRRLEDLRDELAEAERFNDTGRAERASSEIEFLRAELARGVGLGGRSRRAANAAERARQNAYRTIAAVMKKIAEGSPALGEHLAATIRTGLFCTYDPSRVPPVAWTF